MSESVVLATKVWGEVTLLKSMVKVIAVEQAGTAPNYLARDSLPASESNSLLLNRSMHFMVLSFEPETLP